MLNNNRFGGTFLMNYISNKFTGYTEKRKN